MLNVVRRIDLPQGNDIIEDSQAMTLLVVNFPAHSFSGIGGKVEHQLPQNRSSQQAVMAERAYLRKTPLYDSKNAVETSKFSYTQKIQLTATWVEVNPDQPNRERFFLFYAGNIAPWERKGAKTHNFSNPAYTNGDHACVVGLALLMLTGDVDVPDSRPCKKLTKLPPALYRPFTIRPNKSEPLRNNSNAGHSAGTSSAASAAPMRERKRKNEDAEPDRNNSATGERKVLEDKAIQII